MDRNQWFCMVKLNHQCTKFNRKNPSLEQAIHESVSVPTRFKTSEVTNQQEIRAAAVFNVVHSILCTTDQSSSFGFHKPKAEKNVHIPQLEIDTSFQLMQEKKMVSLNNSR